MHKISVIPQPVRITANNGVFRLTADTPIVASEQVAGEAQLLADILNRSTGFSLLVKRESIGDQASIRIEVGGDATHGSEAYQLTVTPHEITITGASPAGAFYGTQTLLQLLPPEVLAHNVTSNVDWIIPCVEIEDYPRFPWRGALVDVARHFKSIECIKKFLDLMALHRMNVFHWHLTDNQGWRLEIKKYPKLTSIGAYMDETEIVDMSQYWHGRAPNDSIPHHGYYTQADAVEIVEYARARHITVMPEIDIPGHSRAAITSYPEFKCRPDTVERFSEVWARDEVFCPTEETFAFWEDILSEVLAIFPSPYIHIGGDEVFKPEWEQSAKVQERMKELGIANAGDMQAYCIHRVSKFLTDRGRRMAGWDEILEGGLPPGATVMSWRGEDGGIIAATAEHDVVMCPWTHVYFDFCQSDNTEKEPKVGIFSGVLILSRVYNYEPIPATMPDHARGRVLGTQAQIWGEFIPTEAHLEYMTFPRLCAIAETMWSLPENRNFDNFVARLKSEHLKRLDALDVMYRPLDD